MDLPPLDANVTAEKRALEIGDPEKSLDEMVSDHLDVFRDSVRYMLQHRNELREQHPGQAVAVRYRYGADPYIVCAPTLEKLFDNLQQQFPVTNRLFDYEQF